MNSSFKEDEIVMQNVVQGGRIINNLLSDDFIGCDFLEFALETTTLSTHPYSTHPNEWPRPVEMVDKWELPADLREKYNASGGEGFALCGIFPEIRKAWASVDNSLFLWGFDEWCRDRECLEYNAGERVICAVGLANSSVFDAIQYLLVLATPIELILVGVCYSRMNNGRDPYEELSLQPLPDYTLPSDGIVMTCITCTDNGRIFLAGCDGHIYELKYSAGSFWQKRCRKVCLTSGLGCTISRLKFEPVDPAIEMVFDNERTILYARTKAMKLQVFELCENGDVLKKVAEDTSLMNQKDAHIVSISPVSTLESMSLQLVVVLSDGRRLYYKTGDWRFICERLPNCLDVVSIRPSPPLQVTGVPLVGHSQSNCFSLKVETSFYSAGTLVLSHSSPSKPSSLIIVSKDYSTQSSRAGHIGTLVHTRRALWESVTHLPLEGRILFVADALPLPDTSMTLDSLYQSGRMFCFDNSGKSLEKALWSIRDLSLQHIVPKRRVIVFSTVGMMELVLNRPIDILKRLLESNSPKEEALEYFFNRFGTAEASAMCLMLAASIADNENLISNIVVDRATEIYENPKFIGMPQLSVQEADHDIVFSGAYEGLRFCSARLLHPLWQNSFVNCECCFDSYVKCGKPVECQISVGAMQVLENKLRSLERFLRLRKIKRRGLYDRLSSSDDFAAMEVRATECLRHLLLRSSEALFLFQLLSKHHMTHLAQSFSDILKFKLRKMKFEELVCSEDGHILATRLISALFEYYTGRDGGGTVDDVIGELCKGCPSYFKEKNYKFYSAIECLERAAESSNITEKESLAREAFNFFNRAPLSGDLKLICKKFEHLRFYEAVVRLPLQRAQVLDPDGNAINKQIDQASQDRALTRRENCYDIIAVALRNLKAETIEREFGLLTSYPQYDGPFLDQSSRKKYICQIVQLAVQSPDRIFLEYLYRTLIDMGLDSELSEYADPDLNLFFQDAVVEHRNEVNEAPASTKAKYLRLRHQVPASISS